MSKKKLTVISALVVLILFFIYFKEFSMPNFVGDRLTEMMKVRVSLEDLDLKWESIKAQNLIIHNPHGSNLDRAMSIENIEIAAPITSYFKSNVEIESMRLDNIYVGIEYLNKKSKEGNWTKIMTNLENAAPKSTVSSNKRVFIKKCILTNLQVELAYTSGSPKSKMYPIIERIELRNIDSENGLPLQEISHAILQETLRQIFSIEGLTNMLLESLQDSSKMKYLVPFLMGMGNDND